MRLEDYIRLAILVGQFETTENIKDRNSLKSVYESLFVYSCLQGTHSFDVVCESLNDAELIGFFIGEVLIEDSIFPDGNGIGSTTPTKFIYSILRQRHLDETDSFLGDWAFRFSRNHYVPYDGSLYYLGTGGKVDSSMKSQSSQQQRILLQDYRYRHPMFYYAIKDLELKKETIEYIISKWEYVQETHPDNTEDQINHFINLMRWQGRHDLNYPLSSDIEDIVLNRVKSFYYKQV